MTRHRLLWMGRFLALPETSFSVSALSASVIEISIVSNSSRNDLFSSFKALSLPVERSSLPEMMDSPLNFSLQRHRQPDGTFLGFGMLFEETVRPSMILFTYEYFDRLGFLLDHWRLSD